MADGSIDGAQSISDILKSLAAEAKITSGVFGAAFADMIASADQLNRRFLQGRERIQELMLAVTKATPEVDRLGGNLKDAVETIEAISRSTQRNVVATANEVSKLYAASKLLEEDVGYIVDSFQEVGVQFSQVGKQLEDSIAYVQSVGGNASQIMGTVLRYTEQINRFNFEGGVVGLTKMATKASLLKFDMQQTVSLAEKALTPEGAIDLANAFQRLGVSAGDLVDPFQLMYKSLNDPEGLQDSIIEMSKQFTIFDEKTKSFKISPQGLLTLREIESQTGLSAREMAKLAVNASDVEKKLSKISPSIEFKNPEDKMYLANIAKLSEAGDYEVTIDGEQRRIQELDQRQIDKLIEEQKKGPKSLEDLQRDQLGVMDLVKGDVKSIRDKVVLGISGAEVVRNNLEGIRTVSATITNTLNNLFKQDFFRKETESGVEEIKGIIDALQSEDPFSPKGFELLQKGFNKLEQYSGFFDENMKKAMAELQNAKFGNSEVEKIVKDLFQGVKIEPPKEKTETKKTTSLSVETKGITTAFTEGNDKVATGINQNNDLTKISNEKLTNTNLAINNLSDSLKNTKQTTTDLKPITDVLTNQLKPTDYTTLTTSIDGLNQTMKNFKNTIMEGTKVDQSTIPTTVTTKTPIFDSTVFNSNEIKTALTELFSKMSTDLSKLIDNGNLESQTIEANNLMSQNNSSEIIKKIESIGVTTTNQNTKNEVSVNGTVVHKIDGLPGLDVKQLEYVVNKPAFVEQFYKNIMNMQKNNEGLITSSTPSTA